jgi:hypothetical protein
MRLLIVMTIAASMLMACASGVPPMMAPPRRLPPPSLTAPCPLPPQPADGRLATSLLPNHVQAMELLALCRSRHQALSAWTLAPDSSPASVPNTLPTGHGHE